MRSAVRFLCRRPAFALTAILTIALGIGANTALFNIIYSVLLRPLPFRDPATIVQVWETHPTLPQLQVTAPDFQDWRGQSRSFEELAAYTLSAMNAVTLLGRGEPVVLHATMASSNLFSLMGIQPSLGRQLNQTDDASKSRVTLLSENLWRQKFGADPAIVGRAIRLGDDSFQVIGVVPQRQAYPEWADIWIPLGLLEPGLQARRKSHPLEVIGRLRAGVTLEQARSEMRTIAGRLAQSHPDTNATVGASVVPLAQQMTASVRPSLLLAWAAVGLVLLIVCANLAQLFLARLMERRQEMAIRAALGAKPWHMIRQLLTESLLIAAIGGGSGVALAAGAGQLARRIAVSQIPGIEWTAFEGPVWLFAVGISLTAGLLFGLPACWQVLRPRARLLATGRTIIQARSRLSAILIAGEVAMAILVLSGAMLLTRSFAALLNEDPGFQARNVWIIPSLPLRSDWPQSKQFLATQLMPSIRGVAGVLDVAAVNSAPLTLGPTDHSRFATRFGIEGRAFQPGSFPVAQNRWTTTDYFRVLGIPLTRGRLLSEPDRDQPRIVINETLARRFFPNQEAVGKRLVLGVMDPNPALIEIVGVVGDVRDLGLDQEAEPTLYGITTSPVMSLLVKTAGGSNNLAASNLAKDLRDAISRADPALPVTTLQPLQQNLTDSLARRRFAVLLLLTFGAMAAFLTAGGIYALLSHSVNVRVREFGIRAAVGAAPGELVSMILREAITVTIPGLVAGLVLALWFAKWMKSAVYQVSPADPLSLSMAAAALVFLTFMAAWLPARRAAAMDPASALRAE